MCNHAKLPEIECKSPVYFVPFATTYLCESVFSTLKHLKNKYQNPLNSSNDLHLALGNCVPKSGQIISERLCFNKLDCRIFISRFSQFAFYLSLSLSVVSKSLA